MCAHFTPRSYWAKVVTLLRGVSATALTSLCRVIGQVWELNSAELLSMIVHSVE